MTRVTVIWAHTQNLMISLVCSVQTFWWTIIYRTIFALRLTVLVGINRTAFWIWQSNKCRAFVSTQATYIFFSCFQWSVNKKSGITTVYNLNLLFVYSLHTIFTSRIFTSSVPWKLTRYQRHFLQDRVTFFEVDGRKQCTSLENSKCFKWSPDICHVFYVQTLCGTFLIS